MRSFRLLTALLMGWLGWLGVSQAQLPSGFIRDTYISGLSQPVGVAFDDNGTMYIWEKGGVVRVVNNGVMRSTPLLDISEEVGNWRDHGLNGFTLDPYFSQNGYIYLLYCVDRHHLMNFGTPDYDPTVDELFAATIGRITRYTVTNPNDPATMTVDPNSRLVLVGATPSSGFPILFGTHGVGGLVFGDDGSLLATAGDGASTAADYGGAMTASYSVQALADGIISTKEDVGVYRPQLLSSLSGKMIRINPATGEGYPTNPFYNPLEPKSAESRTWALGLRNPFSITKKPNSGSHNPADGEPGVFIVGDVGLNRWEEMNVITGPGQNFGWPMYEGMNYTYDFNQGFATADIENRDEPVSGACSQSYYYFRQLLSDIEPGFTPEWPDPCNPGQDIDATQHRVFVHRKPAFAYIHENFDKNVATNSPDYTDVYALASNQDSGEEYDMADPNIPVAGGIDWKGNCAIAGLFYTGTDFPEEYHGLYFHGDHNSAWMRVFDFDLTHNPDSVGDFGSPGQMGFITSMDQHPNFPGFFYVAYDEQTVYHIYYSEDGNRPPKAGMTVDQYYSATNTLTAAFGSSTSVDPEEAPLTFAWDFGDGNTATGDSVTHTFTGVPGEQTVYTVTLTVTDTGGIARTVSRNVFLNNTPPTIHSTSIDNEDFYPLHQITEYDLFADVSDAENSNLEYRWQTILFHEDHNHPEPFDYNDTTSTLADPVGCDGHYYMLQISLRVADSTGLSTTFIQEIYPDCNTPVAQQDFGSFVGGGSERIRIFNNDMALDGTDSTSVDISTPPQQGTAAYDANAGEIVYTHNGTGTSADTLGYRFQDSEGDWSNETLVILARDSAPTITALTPVQNEVVEGSEVKIEYDLTGKQSEVDNLLLTFNGTRTVVDTALNGFITVEDLPEGTQTMTMQLRDAGNQPLSYTESLETRDFEVTCTSSPGSFLLEYWNFIPGGDVSDLTSHPSYPDNPATFNYIVGSRSNNDNTSNDGHRLRGYILPRETDTYYFAAKASDSYEMYLSTDETVTNAALIAYLDSGASMPPNANLDAASVQSSYPTAFSGPITLVDGQRYYFEFIQKAGQFDGFFNIEWLGVNAGTSGHPRNDFREIRGDFTAPWVPCFEETVSFPVELLDFSATLDGSEVLLRWTTASERDNDYFVIQRSTEGDSFEDLIREPSLGNSNEVQTYRAVDTRPLAGQSFYRLKQVDLDGTTTFSNTVEVSVSSEQFLIFPNPGVASQGFRVDVFGDKGSTYRVQLLNQMGQVVYADQTEGSVSGNSIEVPANRLSPGQYLMRVYNATEQWTEKVILR